MIRGWVNGQTWSHRYSGPTVKLHGIFGYVGVGAPVFVLFKGQLDNTSVLQSTQPTSLQTQMPWGLIFPA